MSTGGSERRRVIRASEIGEYVWCRRAWWLGRVKGVPNANRAALDAGTARHQAHGQVVARARRLEQGARLLLIAALALAVVLGAYLAVGAH